MNQRLDRPEPAVELRQRGVDRLLVGDVGRDDGQVGAEVAEPGPERIHLRVAPARDRDPMTVFEQALRDGTSQRSGSPGDEHSSTHVRNYGGGAGNGLSASGS